MQHDSDRRFSIYANRHLDMRGGLQLTLLVTLLLGCNNRTCHSCTQAPTRSVATSYQAERPHEPAQSSDPRQIAEEIYDAGLKNGWQDWGWAPHDLTKDGPVKVRFDNWGGWILAKPGNSGEYGGLLFRIKPVPGQTDFLRVSLWSDSVKMTPVNVSSVDQTDAGDGWVEVYLPLDKLDPEGLPFDRIVLHAARLTGPEFVSIDRIALTKARPHLAVTTDPSKTIKVSMAVDCSAKVTKISPYIYGNAYYPFDDAPKQASQWQLKATARRWGGNATSTYNWEAHAWNTGNDYYFENHPIAHETFLDENSAHDIVSVVTVPIMGWVAKDVVSSSFPVSVFGAQESTDQWRPDAGNGKGKNGKEIKPGPPTRAYQRVTPDFVKRWVQSIRQGDAKTGKRRVWMYILDNEPMIWSTTHRDAHVEPLSFDELVERTIQYGTAVREADPAAVIAGPAEWGWMGYMYSGKDMANGGPSARPDRRAHGDLPVVAYYLKALAEHEKKTGVRVLDVLDLHGSPYADGVCSTRTEPSVAATRIRSTRMLWDPTYVDESWVKEPVKLLPRMRDWIDQYYPGRGMSLGEWNFGGEMHMSGSLATAEALGRFAQFGVASAFYWAYPPANSPTTWAFRAYRDYNGQGGHFLDWFTPASVTTQHSSTASLFVSRDDSGKHMVAVLLNFSPYEAISANVELGSCGTPSSMQAWTYNGQANGFKPSTAIRQSSPKIIQTLPPYSITVLDIQLSDGPSIVH